MKNKIRILVADDHALLRFGLISFIAGKDDMLCVGEAENGQQAVELARKLKPDVVVMDLMMPILNGADATRIISKASPGIRILILTSFGTSPEIMAAIDNGASGALLKDTPTEKLIEAIRAIASGQKVFPDNLQQRALSSSITPKLSGRQSEILAAIARGLSNDDIGKLLGISGETVKKHLSILFNKIGASNRAEAVALALRKHLLKI